MSQALEKWERDLADARKAWQAERTPQAFEGYVMWCAGCLCSPEMAATKKHWFCSDEGTRETALNSLAMFSFVAPQNSEDPTYDAYHRYLRAFTSLVSSCQSCARGYQQSREQLVLRLFADGPFEQKQVVGFVKELNYKDRTRLMGEIEANKNSIPVLTEILWSATCMKNHGFVTKYLIEPGLLTGGSSAINEVGACPGMIALAFGHNYRVRQAVVKHITGHAKEYEQSWLRSPEMYQHFFLHGMKSYSKAKMHADLAWFTAGQLVSTIGANEMLEICFAELAQDHLGLPRFGAHFLLICLLDACIRNGISPDRSQLQRAIEYVCVPNAAELLVPGSTNEASQAAQKSESYRKLSARTIIEWVKLYSQLDRDVKPAGLVRPLSWLLELPRSAYNSPDSYAYTVQVSLKIISENLNDETFCILDRHADRIVESIDRCSPESVWRLWQYQVSHQESFSPIWAKIIRSPSIAMHSARQGHHGYILGLFQGSRDIPLLYKQPRVNEPAPIPCKAEELFKELLETLTDNTEAEQLVPLFKDPQALYSVLFATMSGNRGIALASEEFIKSATTSESLEAAVLALVQLRADAVLDSLVSLLSEAKKLIGEWFSVLSGLLRLSSEALEQIYAPQSGIDTTDAKSLQKLKEMWPASWSVVRVVLSNIRPWAREYGNAQAKPIISKILEFSQRLLSKFRLLEADLTAGLSGVATEDSGEHWGTVLAQPVMDCVPAMADLLQLSMPEMLAVAHEIIVDMLGLMRSFQVPVTTDLFTLFKQLGNHTRNSKLTEDQLRDLLAATGLLSDVQITEVMNAPRDTPNRVSAGASQTSLKARPLGYSSQSQAQQHAISDFFQRGSGPQPLPQRTVINNQVVSSAPLQSSSMLSVRNQLARSHAAHAAKQQPLTIHPERPPGFNQRKPLQQDESDDSEDDSGGALSMLKQKRREEATAKLREAYNNKPRTSLMLPPGSENEATMRAAREREVHRMKARLTVEPTELHRVMLQWDYFSVKPQFKADLSVPDVFTSVNQYEEVMAPLLFLETWEQIQNAKLEPRGGGVKPFYITLGKRVKVDGFTDIYVSIAKGQYVDAGIGESDLILIGKTASDGGTPYEISREMPHCFARLKEGTVRYSGSKQNQFVDLQIRVNDNSGFVSSLHQGVVVSAQVVGNMRTVEREYCALKALPYYDLAEDIIKAQPQAFRAQPDQVSRLQQTMTLNSSQAEAVSGSLSHEGFSLIQGPPGTGKTKTILGIIGSYFSNNDLVAQAKGSSTAEKKILVCAPSNAAVDEIVVRLKEGVKDSRGNHVHLNVLRLGRLDAMSEQVRDVSLEEQVNRLVSGKAEPADEQLRKDHTALTQQRDELRQKLANTEETLSENDIVTLRSKLGEINRAIREKNYALDLQRERLDQARKQRDLQYRQQQNDILVKSQVVCTTLSASAHPLLASLGITFPTVIIDEAAQSIELSALIPMKYGCRQCIMVGDPNQLPPTVISRAASRLKYEQSLFVRMFNQHHNKSGMVSMLDTQFRMHPEISLFPSQEFYENRLKNGDGLEVQRRRPWHSKYPALGPYMFFEVKGKHERSNGRSLRNNAEAKSALALVKLLRREFPEVESIGVISPYREQVRLLRQTFVQHFGPEITTLVDFNSIDGFQGQEKDVILMSCVRASSAQNDSVGFVGDVRRMNVAVTRAKSSLWILGNSDSLAGNEVWRALIDNAKERDCFCKAEDSNFTNAVTRFKRKTKVPDSRSRSATPSTAESTPSVTPVPETSDEDDQREAARKRKLPDESDDNTNGVSKRANQVSGPEDVSSHSDVAQVTQFGAQLTADFKESKAPHSSTQSSTMSNAQNVNGIVSRKTHRPKGPASVFIKPRRGPGARHGRT